MQFVSEYLLSWLNRILNNIFFKVLNIFYPFQEIRLFSILWDHINFLNFFHINWGKGKWGCWETNLCMTTSKTFIYILIRNIMHKGDIADFMIICILILHGKPFGQFLLKLNCKELTGLQVLWMTDVIYLYMVYIQLPTQSLDWRTTSSYYNIFRQRNLESSGTQNVSFSLAGSQQ